MNDPSSPSTPSGHPDAPHGSVHRARRLLETALGTPEPSAEGWPAAAWRPPSVAQLQSWVTDYEVTARFARGSSGAVYAGRHRLLERQVALKVLAPVVGAEPAANPRLQTEGRLLATLGHPHILRVYDSRPLPGGLHLLVFDFAEGGSLRQRLAAGPPLREDEIIALGAQLAAGLAHAHGCGVVHRDLKPENILFDPHGTALIADFGSAMFTGPEMESSGGGTTGTADYRAPEQAVGRPPHPAADLYSLGVILHELLIGQFPPSPADPSLSATLHSSVPPRLRPILSALLGPEAARRSLKTPQIQESLQALLLPPPPAAPRLMKGLAVAIALLLIGAGWLASRWNPPPGSSLPAPAPSQPNQVPAMATRFAVVEALDRFRDLEAKGAWTESHAAYAPVVDYFDRSAISRERIALERGDFAAKRAAFRSVRLKDPEFLASPSGEVRLNLISWSETPHLNQAVSTLGFSVEQFTWTPATGGSWPWQILRQANQGSNYWSAPTGRVLEASAATDFIDAFLTAEAADDRPAQLKAFAERFLYYGSGWQNQTQLLEAIGHRQADRPDFRCQRLGPVVIEPGSLSRWKVSFPSLSGPRHPRSADPGPPTPGSRVFLIVPGPGPRWFILAEASRVAGLPELDRFFKANH